MKQIIINYLIIFIIPFLVGFFACMVFRKWSKAWLITITALAAVLLALIIALTVPNRGSELYGLRFIQTGCLLLGCVLSGLLSRMNL